MKKRESEKRKKEWQEGGREEMIKETDTEMNREM